MSVTPGHWTAHVRPTLSIAVPVMFSRAGLLLMVAVDTAMCGHAGQQPLAFYGLGSAAQVPLMLFGIGMMMGVSLMVAQADGAGQAHRSGTILASGLLHAAGYGLLLWILCLFGTPFFLWTGQAADLAQGAGNVVVHFGWGLPAALLFSALAFYLEAVQRPLPALVVMIIANVINLLLNIVMISGVGDWPGYGASGAAIATSAVRWMMCLALGAYVYLALDAHYYGLRKKTESLSVLGKRFRKMGYPMALGQGLESASFAIMAIFAGWVGAVAVGAWSIGMNVLAILFMLSLGFTTACGVRVANAMGRFDRQAVLLAAWTGFGLCICMQLFVGTLTYLLKDHVSLIYSADPVVLIAAATAISFVAVVLVPDGLQAVLVGMLRGTSDFWPPAIVQFIAFWLVMLPIGYWLGVKQGYGAGGLMAAVGVGALVAVILLIARFVWVSNTRLRRLGVSATP